MRISTNFEHNSMKKLIFMSKGTVSFSIIQYNRVNMVFFLTLGKRNNIQKLHRGEANDPSIKNY